MKKIYSLILFCSLMFFGLTAQEVGTTYEPEVSENTYFDISQPLTEIGPIAPTGASGHHQHKKDPSIPKLNHETVYKNLENALPKGNDPAWQQNHGLRGITPPIENFQGIRNDDNGAYEDLIAPPDTDGDVGPNHYFQMCNTVFEIFDKNGTTLFGPADNSTIWSGFIGDWTGTNDGDPIVLYDEQADRWLVTQFAVDTDITGGTYWILVAISTSPDPTGAYFRYAFEYDKFPDYPKFGIWRDGYYLMVQHGNGTATASALNRSQMLAGNATVQRVTYSIPNLPGSGFSSVLPSDNDGDWAPSGTPNYFVYFSDDAWGSDPVDRLKIWEFDVNWTFPFFSSLTLTQNLNTAAFSSAFGSHNQGIIPQPGTTRKLAIMEKALMNRLQYRNFGTYESMVCCHTVDVNGSNRAGTRWYELRKTTGSWYIYQQGTYAPGTTDNYWMASIAQNASGDIALGYSVSSSSTYPSIRYTGRKLGDALGQMTMGEQVIFNGSHAQEGTSRWGDYTMMSVDPSDDETFWYTNEYNDDYTDWGNWITQIASFQVDEYCAASGGCDEHIARVEVGTIDNSSGCDGYANYMDMSTDVPVNSSEPITVTNGNTNYDADQCGIWIDWNDDGDFADANETLTVSESPGVGPYFASISPPAGTSLGEKKMRIRITYNQTPDPCGSTSYGEVEDYTINVSAAVPNYWTGGFNFYWHNAGNWSLGHIPTLSEDVIITDDGYHPPTTGTHDETVKSLTIQSGAALRLSTGKLYVNEDMNIHGEYRVITAGASTYCYGNVNWYSGSTADIEESNTFWVWGNMEFFPGSDVQMGEGTVAFSGTSTSWIRNKSANTVLNNLSSYKGVGGYCWISDLTNQDLIINNLLYTHTNSHFGISSDYDVILKGDFYNNGTFNFLGASNTGTFVFDGTSQSIVMNSLDGVFNNVRMSATGTVSANGNISIAGDLLIESGQFNPQGNSITITGDWQDNLGPDGFVEAGSRVTFDGPGHQYIYGDEHFNILEVNNGAALRINNVNYDVSCNSYDWTAGGIDIVAGNFTALDLFDSGLWGTYWCNPGGTLTLNQDGGQYTDLSGEIHIFGGTMTVNGGLGASWWPYNTDAVVVMTGGVLDFPDSPIRLSTGFDLTTDISGGTIRTPWSFWDYRGDFTPSGGTLELYGTSDATLLLEPGSHTHNLLINKAASDEHPQSKTKMILEYRDGTKEIISRSNQVTVTNDLLIVNNFTINNGTFIAPDLMQIGGLDGGNWENNVGPDAFVEGDGKVSFIGSYNQFCSSEIFNTLELNKPNGDFSIWYGRAVECQSYIWIGGEIYVNDGTFTAWDLFDEGVFGKYFLTDPNSTVNLYQDDGQWIDLNGEIIILDGIMNIFGGLGNSFWPFSADARIRMEGGILDFVDNGVYLNGNSTYTLVEEISGGTIRTSGGFYNESSTFTPSGGTVELYGTNDAAVGFDGGGFFYDLLIKKGAVGKSKSHRIAQASKGQTNSSKREESIQVGAKSNTAFAYTNFNVENNLNIESGIFDVVDKEVLVDNRIDIFGTLKMMDEGGSLTGFSVAWKSGSDDIIDAGDIFCNIWDFEENTLAKLGIGNTAHVYSGFNMLFAEAEMGNLEMGYGGTKFILDNKYDMALNTLGYAKLLSGSNWGFNVPMNIGTDFTIEESASFLIYDELTVGNNLILQGELDYYGDNALIHGGLTFPSTGSLTINGGNVVFDAANHPDKGWEYINGHVEMPDGLFEFTHNSMNFGSTATTNISGGILRTGGAFYATGSGVFEPTGGTVEIIGNAPDDAIYCYGGNYFYNLLINREPDNSCQFIGGNAVEIKNDLSILSGSLNTGSSDMFVGGNWTNLVGSDGFVENENVVWFFGETFSHILSDETFYNLYIFDMLTDKNPGGGGRFVEETYIDENLIVNVSNNCHILGGSLNLASNSTLDIEKNLSITAGAEIIVPDMTFAELFLGGNFDDFNAASGFSPGYSTFTFDGSVNQELNSNSWLNNFYDLVMNNQGDHVSIGNGLQVYGDLLIQDGAFVDNGSDSFHYFYGDVNVAPNGALLPHRIVSFIGDGSSIFADNSTGSSYFHSNVFIDKDAPNVGLTIASSMLLLNGASLTVNEGFLDLNTNLLRCTGSVTINDGGKITVDEGAELEVGENKQLTIDDGGRIEILGESGNRATVSAWNAPGKFTFDIASGGTIRAEHGIFEHMAGLNGVNVMDGAFVDPAYSFNNCTFRNGSGETNSALLVINNDQTLTITGASFPDASTDFNVAKDIDQGQLTFIDFTGSFSGEDFDYDNYDRVDWYLPSLEVLPPLRNVSAAAGSTTFAITSNLDWTVSENTSWFSVTPLGGSNNGSLTVNYSQNSSTSSRSGQITISADGVPDVIATVNQFGDEVYLIVTPANQDVDSEAGSTTFNISSNISWTVSESSTWLDLSPTNGSGDALITVNYDENPTGLERLAYITVAALGGMPFQNVTVTQASYPIQNITVPQGWSGLSSYIMPANNAIEDVFDFVSGDFIIASTQSEVYYPAGPINTIITWDSQSAYKIKMGTETILPVIGNEESNKTYNLNAGWNLVPVICNVAASADGIFAGTNLELLKDVAGFGIMWPAYNINTIGVLVPGRAYYALMNTSGSITYPENAKEAGAYSIIDPVFPATPWTVNLSGPSTHIIAIPGKINGIAKGDLLAVVDENENCYGLAEIMDLSENSALTVHADDPYTNNRDGFDEGSTMMLKLYRPSTMEVFDVEAIYDTEKPNRQYFASEGISAITQLKILSLGINQTNADAISLYPNPTNGMVGISGISDFKKIEIFNTNGKLMRAVAVENQDQYQLDLSDLQSGVYQLKFTGNFAVAVKKLIKN